jgi:hypothetical protein
MMKGAEITQVELVLRNWRRVNWVRFMISLGLAPDRAADTDIFCAGR